MIKNIIAIINFNHKNYCIYQKNNNIDYALLNKSEFEFNIDDKDINILNKLYHLIRYNDKSSFFCGNYKINNKNFEIYQDIRSSLYTYVLKEDNKRYIPNKEDAILLNSYFNDEQFVYYTEKQEKEEITNDTNKKGKPVKFIKKVLKVAGITAVALISATIITYNLPQSVKSNIDYELGKNFRTDITQKDKSYTFDDIIIAIDSNNNIPKKDKSFIKECFEAEFEENKEYIDIEKIIKRLETLKVQYDKYYTYNEKTGEYEFTHSDDVPASVTAYYNVLNNKMTCIEGEYSESEIEEKKDEQFGFEEVNKATYFHELNHLLTIYGLDSSESQVAEELSFVEVNDYIRTNTGFFEKVTDDMQGIWNTGIFRETINEIFSQEYVDKYYQRNKKEARDIAYSNDLPFMYCLAEILPTDVLREYKFNDNDSIITEGLLNINDNKVEAYKLMTSLKSISLYENLIWRAETNNNLDKYFNEVNMFENEETEEVKQAKEAEKENYQRIHDGFAYFYKIEYNRDMSDDMNMLIYLYNTPVLTNEEKQKVRDFLNISDENTKIKFDARGYFAKDYIEANPCVIAKYKDKDFNEKSITIDNDIRYLSNKIDLER